MNGEGQEVELKEVLAEIAALIEPVRCPIYFIKKDSFFSLIWGNSAFFKFINCPREDMDNRYAGRLGDFWDKKAMSTLAEMAGEEGDGTSKSLKHKMKRADGKELLVSTEICRGRRGEEAIFLCLSFDITKMIAAERNYLKYGEIGRLFAEMSDRESFFFNPSNRSARILGTHSVFVQLPPADPEGYLNFPELVIEAGLVHPEDEEIFRWEFGDVIRSGEKVVGELRMRVLDGGYEWFRFAMYMEERDNHLTYMLGILENITPQKESMTSYLIMMQFFQELLAEKEAFAQIDVTEDRITKVGGIWNIYNEIINKVTFSDLFGEFVNKVVHPDDRSHYSEVMRCDNFIQSYINGISRLGCEFRRIVDQNKMVWMELSVYLSREPFTQHILALLCIKDIDKKKRQELSLQHDSQRDALTNVYQRKMVESYIRSYLDHAEAGEICAFTILDLDNFKKINDQFGHEAGDRVLIKFANIIKASAGEDDIVGRYGGDEFILFLKDVISEQQVTEKVEGIYEKLKSEDSPEISCSAGIAMTSGPILYELAFRQADAALYDAKNDGKSKFSFYRGERAPVEGPAVEGTELRRKTAKVLSRFSVGASDRLLTFDELLSRQGDIAYLVDPDSFLLLCGNQSFYDRIGRTEAECAGMKCYEVLHRRESPCPFCSKANWSTDKYYMWKNYNESLEQEFLIKNKLVQWHGEEALLAIAVDISNDKSIVDSLDNGMVESRSLLSGIQQMSAAPDLESSIRSALEAIGGFFRADSVHFWEKGEEQPYYEANFSWRRNGKTEVPVSRLRALNNWLENQTWIQPIMVENPEAVLCESFGMYQFMKDNGVENQRWVRLKEKDGATSFISVDNISINFQNVAFLESFSVFIAGELRKRRLIERMPVGRKTES